MPTLMDSMNLILDHHHEPCSKGIQGELNRILSIKFWHT